MTTERNPYQGLFNQNSEETQRILNPENDGNGAELVAAKTKLPTIQREDRASEDELKSYWKGLRAFFVGEGQGQSGVDGMLPATFAPFIGKAQIEESYPLLVAQGEHISLSSLLRELAEQQSANEHYPILERLLPKLIQNVRDQGNSSKVVSFENALSEGFQAFRKQIEMAPEDRKHLMVMLGELERNATREGGLIPFGAHLPYLLLDGVLEYDNGPKHKLLEKVKTLISDLGSLYEHEKSKRNGAGSAKDASLGFAEDLVNLDSLASVSPSSTTQPMDDDRFNRIATILDNLKKVDAVLSSNAWMVAETGFAKSIGTDLTSLFQNTDIATCENGTVCANALKIFEQNIGSASCSIAYIRMAELEINGKYDSAQHDPFFKNFSWRQFSEEEFAACPPTVVLIDDAGLIKHEMGAFSDLLSQDLPIRFMVIRTEDFELSETAKLRIRQEIASIAIAHRNTYVYQSVLVDPDKAFAGMANGMRLLSPSVFHLLLPNEKNAVNPLLWSSAAVESRAFPSISYSGMSEARWGSRWNIDQNPQVGNSWPTHEIQLENEQVLNSEFTFADFMSLEGVCHSEFMKVDARFWTDELIPLSAYLALDDAERKGKIPFIWMVNEELTLFRVAVSWKAAMASLERLDHWRYLQESGGVHNYHAEHALEAREADLSENAQREIENLKAEHQKELETVRNEATEKAMENLTSVLLDLDTSVLSSSATRTPQGSSVSTKAAEPEVTKTKEEEPGKEEDEDALGPTEAWIETPLCTACDECTNLNDKIFKYNSDKKAYVADPKAGTFAELVKAAENCTVSIIHPGTPLNPNEPGLDDLIARADKYN